MFPQPVTKPPGGQRTVEEILHDIMQSYVATFSAASEACNELPWASMFPDHVGNVCKLVNKDVLSWVDSVVLHKTVRLARKRIHCNGWPLISSIVGPHGQKGVLRNALFT